MKTEQIAILGALSAPHRGSIIPLFVASLAIVGLCLPGCNNLSDVDARTRQLLVERSAMVGGGAIAPDRTFPSTATARRSEQLEKAPTTANPAAGDLPFTPAQESRDVAARLEAYEKREEQGAAGTQVLKLSLEEAFRIGQRSASEYLTSEEDYIFSALNLLIERHLWGPRLFNDTTVDVAGQGDQGNIQSALHVLNDMRLTQRLPYGGTVEAQWLWNATNQLRDQATKQYTQSSELILSATIPLLRGAGYIAQESLIQAERNLIYQARSFEAARRNFLVQIASDYFDLLEARSAIGNQEKRLESLRRIEQQQRAMFEAGRIAAFEANIAANNVLEATATLAGQNESYILALDRFKIRLGVGPDRAVELDEKVLDIPEPDVTLDQATGYALAYRLDLQNQRDQVDDSRRAVENAKNQLLPDLNLSGSVGFPTDPDAREGGVAFQPRDLNYRAGATFGMPLDRDAERLALRQATISLQQRERNYSVFRDQVAVGVRQAVRNIDLARFQLRLAEERVKVNEQRVEELRLKADEVNTQTQVDAANNLQESRNELDRARTALRNAVLAYLRDSGLLRVKRDGTFEPLPGMEQPAQPPAPAPANPPSP